ncbi:MAG TPA: pirin family protein [Alphaproteobacteria bacterium]|nr:pirin family protein [Alphaproteobacteria bacterium]
MSWLPSESPVEGDTKSCKPVQTVVVPRARDIGGFDVRRVLPSAQQRMVGPFVFFDQMGPVTFPGGNGIDVRPHPHIGLATVTYLFEGTIIHRDSLGSEQAIRPGDVNWMTAGRGIVHSERSDAELRKEKERLHGLQLWVALPKAHEEAEPDFTHYPGADLPAMEGEGIKSRIIAGSALGLTSPVKTYSDLFYLDVALDAGARIALDAEHEERAGYIIEGKVEIEGSEFEAGRLLGFAPTRQIVIKATTPAKLVLLGGEPMDGPRHLWWNFVSSSQDRIEQAKEDWRRNRFGLPVPNETEFIPLPGDS